MPLHNSIPSTWQEILSEETIKPYFSQLQHFLEQEWLQHTIYPPREQIFAALELTAFQSVKVVLLGQDPYHDENQAEGLCFSVRRSVPQPPSLRNIFKELESDLGIPRPTHGSLKAWAQQGVLLLNTVFTVRSHQAHSHAGQGWEIFTDAIIRAVNRKSTPVLFLLWGGAARKKLSLIDSSRHKAICSAHPSPLSAYRGFFGSKPFSAVNASLAATGQQPINWQIEAQTDLLPGFSLGNSA